MPIINDKGRRLLRQIHWMSAAFSLMALLFYAATGFLLNNDGLIRDGGAKTHIEKPLSESLKTEFTTTGSDQPTLSLKARSELEKTFGLDLRFAKQRNAKGRVTITLPDPAQGQECPATMGLGYRRGRHFYYHLCAIRPDAADLCGTRP